MLGLSKDKVKLVPYDKEWEKVYSDQKAQIMDTLKDRKILVEHIGSTAIPGLKAKPIIDLAIGINSKDEIDDIVKKLESIGVFPQPIVRLDDTVILAKGDPVKFHIHLMEKSGKSWKRQLAIRDHLIKHPRLAKEYQTLKEKLAKEFANERAAYTKHKRSFIMAIYKRSQFENRITKMDQAFQKSRGELETLLRNF